MTSKSVPNKPAAQPASQQPAQRLPAANVFAAPTGRSTITVVCEPGKDYGISLAQAGETVVLPFRLPANVTGPVPVVLASTDANWLGRNGAKLKVHICTSVSGAVALQPHGQGLKANAYTKGSITTVAM